MEWHPISEAPEDGREFLVYVPAWTDSEGWEIGAFTEVCTRWDDGSIVGCRTHCSYDDATLWSSIQYPHEIK